MIGVELAERVERVVVKGLYLTVGRQVGPGSGRDLLAAVGPVIGIMEVEQRLKARRMLLAECTSTGTTPNSESDAGGASFAGATSSVAEPSTVSSSADPAM